MSDVIRELRAPGATCTFVMHLRVHHWHQDADLEKGLRVEDVSPAEAPLSSLDARRRVARVVGA